MHLAVLPELSLMSAKAWETGVGAVAGRQKQGASGVLWAGQPAVLVGKMARIRQRTVSRRPALGGTKWVIGPAVGRWARKKVGVGR